jgi:hypothetical protein
MDPGQEGDEHGQGDRGVEEPEQRADPPGGPVEQREGSGIAEGEALPDGEVDEEPRHPGLVGIFGDDGAEQ